MTLTLGENKDMMKKFWCDSGKGRDTTLMFLCIGRSLASGVVVVCHAGVWVAVGPGWGSDT